MAIPVNTQAPEFTLKQKTADGLQDVSLSDNFGKKKTVLLFFPAAFTSVCQDELCSVSGGLEDYQNLDAVVWGISVDLPFSQEVFKRSAGINFPILSDFNKEVSSAYGVLYEDFIGFKGVSKRSAFVIDTDGTVVFSFSSDDPKQLPPFDQIKAALA
jgi:peroxiredoxin